MINKVKFKVKGNSAYPVNMLSKRGIRLSKIRFTDDGVSFVVDAKDYDNCREYLEEFNRKYAVLSEKGIVYYWRKLKKRAGAHSGGGDIFGCGLFVFAHYIDYKHIGEQLGAHGSYKKQGLRNGEPPAFQREN